MLTAYCVRRAEDPPPDRGLAGIGGAPVRSLAEGGLALWLSEGEPGRPTLERIREHDGVVRAALRSATPLPVRFGAAFPDEAAARAALRERSAELLAALERVAGRVEMGLRLVWPPAPPPPRAPVRSGREYLEARRREVEGEAARRARATELLDSVERHFHSLELSSVREVLPEPAVAGTVAHLVHRSLLRDYRRCAESARDHLRGADLQLSGPWAPYSFVGSP